MSVPPPRAVQHARHVAYVAATALVLLACDSGDSSSGRVDPRDDASSLVDLAGPPDSTPSGDTAGTIDTASPPDTADTAQPDTTAPDMTAEPEVTAPDATPEVDAPPDAQPEVEGDTAPDTAPDIAADVPGPAPDATVDAELDTASDTTDAGPDATISTCADRCPEVGPGPTNVVITNDGTNEAPALAGLAPGSALMSGLYELNAITVYTKGAFNAVIVTSATVSNGGDTSGTAHFVDTDWAFFFDLDLSFDIRTIAGNFDGDSRTAIQGGGCFTIAGNLLMSDTAACALGWPTGVTPPQQLEFGYDSGTGRLLLKVVLSPAFILALIPPEDRALAELVITGPIRFTASFAPAP